MKRLTVLFSMIVLAALIAGCSMATGDLTGESDGVDISRGLVSTNKASWNHNDYFSMGSDRYYLNNQWGMYDTNRETSDSWQKIYKDNNGKYCVEYNLWTKDQKNNMVLGYPSILSGWHYGQSNPGAGKAGFPVRIYDSKDIMTSWSVSHSNWADWECYNVAYDIWIGGINEKTPSKPDTEVMVWLNRQHQAPLGSKVKSVWNKWGTGWDFYASYPGETGNPGWTVYSFIRRKGTWSISKKDLTVFIDWLWNNDYLDGRKYVVGVEAGQEILQGKGKFVNNNYSLWIK